ncbi:MAG: tetratricopeptide repeat protein [Elusimicrobia bacterium]|nr:tetratricopeptide repeat protein [Elusimicrobiota bacterium]
MTTRPLAFSSALLFCTAAAGAAWWPFGPAYGKPLQTVRALSAQGRSADVLTALNPVFMQTLRSPDLRDAYLLRGEAFEALGRPDAALGEYQVGTGLFPKSVVLLTHEGSLLHHDGLDEHARELFKLALGYEPKNWRAHLGLAEIESRLGFLDRSAAHYESALEARPAQADAWRDYAGVLFDLREPTAAEYALHKSLDLAPNDAAAHVLLAFVLRAQDDYPGAFAQLDAAAALGGGTGVLRAKALWLLEAGRRNDAAAAATAILAVEPGDPVALWVRARLLLPSDPSGAAKILEPFSARADDAPFSARAAAVLRDAALQEAQKREKIRDANANAK